jgi:uncharacterized membrane protein
VTMNIVNASAGRQWVKEGWRIYRLQPMLFLLLFLMLFITTIVLNVIPFIGPVLSAVLTPALSMVLTLASKRVSEAGRTNMSVIADVFQSNTLGRLIWLGSVYLITGLAASLLALAATNLVDTAGHWQIVSTVPNGDQSPLQIEPKIAIRMILTSVFCVPVALAFWYAAPLIMWRNMGVAKAMFFSAIAVKRNLPAFAMYVATWLVFGIFLPLLAVSLIAAIAGATNAAAGIALPIVFIATTVLYCSFYPTYLDVFGKPDMSTETEVDQPAT